VLILASTRIPTELLIIVLLPMSGEFPTGRVILIALQGFPL